MSRILTHTGWKSTLTEAHDNDNGNKDGYAPPYDHARGGGGLPQTPENAKRAAARQKRLKDIQKAVDSLPVGSPVGFQRNQHNSREAKRLRSLGIEPSEQFTVAGRHENGNVYIKHPKLPGKKLLIAKHMLTPLKENSDYVPTHTAVLIRKRPRSADEATPQYGAIGGETPQDALKAARAIYPKHHVFILHPEVKHTGGK